MEIVLHAASTGAYFPAMAPKGGSNDPRLMLKLQTAIVDTERLGELFLDVRRQASFHAHCAKGRVGRQTRIAHYAS